MGVGVGIVGRASRDPTTGKTPPLAPKPTLVAAAASGRLGGKRPVARRPGDSKGVEAYAVLPPMPASRAGLRKELLGVDSGLTSRGGARAFEGGGMAEAR